MCSGVVAVNQLILEHLFSDEAPVEDCDETIRCACLFTLVKAAGNGSILLLFGDEAFPETPALS